MCSIYVRNILQACFSPADSFGSLTGFHLEVECFTNHFRARLSADNGVGTYQYKFSAGLTCNSTNGTEVWECDVNVCCSVY